jgi:hypothetical protein
VREASDKENEKRKMQRTSKEEVRIAKQNRKFIILVFANIDGSADHRNTSWASSNCCNSFSAVSNVWECKLHNTNRQ